MGVENVGVENVGMGGGLEVVGGGGATHRPFEHRNPCVQQVEPQQNAVAGLQQARPLH